MRTTSLTLAICLAGSYVPGTATQSQLAVGYAPSTPYLTAGAPLVIDEAHRNYHTAAGRYRPFVDLVTAAGYNVTSNSSPFTAHALQGFGVLVIANAQGSVPIQDDSAFTETECDLVRDWVAAGGGLLLVADHYPYAGAAAPLAQRFDVKLSRGITEDPAHSDVSSPAFLIFTRASGQILPHPVTDGRDPRERVSNIMTFGGTSMVPPPGAIPFLKLSSSAHERQALSATARAPGQSPLVRYGDPVPPSGSAQAVALEFGRGRVVVLGEAGMITAQHRGVNEEPFGMNVQGVDNRQLALNIVGWLSHRLLR